VPKRPKTIERADSSQLKRPSNVQAESSFTIAERDRNKIIAWAKKQDAKAVQMQLKSGAFQDNPMVTAQLHQDVPYYGACGGALTYSFTPTSIGTVLTVTHGVTKEKLDLTDYDSW
jgi:hypothetical protein